MNNIIEIKNLTKFYSGKEALADFNLEIGRGRIVGILGPNGSGKTTLLKLMAGLLRETKGEILIDGHRPGVYTKSILAFLPDRNFLYKWMKVSDALEFFQDFFDDFDIEKAREMIAFMDLKEDMDVDSLSKGMSEKLNLCLILSRNAKVHILDEPIGGVDVLARDQILDAIITNFSPDSTMIITTHLIDEMENMFDEVVFLKEGRLHSQGQADDLREENGMQIAELYKKIFA